MLIEIDKLKIYYEIKGYGKPVLFLHGWGGQIESFKPVFEHLALRFQVCGLDFPGFGRSNFPSYSWGVKDYTHCLIRFLEKIGIQKTNVIAHSFGGRIAISLAAYFPEKIEKLVLVDSAGIKPKQMFSYYFKMSLLRLGKRFFSFLGEKGKKNKEKLAYRLGSNDYKKAGPLRDTLIKIVNEDLKSLLPLIKAKTLIIWGENDKAVPLKYAKIMEKEIKKAELIVLKNAGHFSYLDKFSEFCHLVNNFLDKNFND